MTPHPYAVVDGLPFSATMADVRQWFGVPQHEAHSGIGLHERDHGRAVYRFQQGGRLEEVAVRARLLHLPDVAVPAAEQNSRTSGSPSTRPIVAPVMALTGFIVRLMLKDIDP